MTQEILIKHGTPIVWANSADYSSTVSGLSRTHQIDLHDLAAGSARQGAKANLGSPRPAQYLVTAAFEFDSAPVSLQVVEVYWSGSPITTAANANPGLTSGADAAYTGTAGDSLNDSIVQLMFLGNLVATADASAVVQYQTIGVLGNCHQFGMPVVYNRTGQAMAADGVDMYVALVPLVDEAAAVV